MSPANFQRMLDRMNAEPHRCQWCGGTLPPSFVRQHQDPHNHREEIVHHFHPGCWKARLVAVAVIFGHMRPQDLLPRNVKHEGVLTLRKTVTWTVHGVFRTKLRSQNHRPRRWLR